MGALDNKTILFSGVFAGHERSDLEKQAVAAGAKLLSGVTKNLNYLVAGDKMGPQKKDKADELGIPIITLQDFFDMVGGATIAASAPELKAKKEPEPPVQFAVDHKAQWKAFENSLESNAANLKFDTWRKVTNKNGKISAGSKQQTQISQKILDFYRQMEECELIWTYKKNESVRGFINILPLKSVLGSWEGVIYFDEMDSEDDEKRNFKPIDFFVGEACVGFYMNKNYVSEELYIYTLEDDPEGLNVDMDGYIQLMYMARGYAYWPCVLLGLQGDSDHNVTEDFKKYMPEVFPDFRWEEFVALYDSVRLDHPDRVKAAEPPKVEPAPAPVAPAKPAKPLKKKKVAEVQAKTYNDFFDYAMSSLDTYFANWSGSYRKGDLYTAVAVAAMRSMGDMSAVPAILDRIPQEQFAQWGSRIGFHCLKRFNALPVPDLEKRITDAIPFIEEFRMSDAHAYLSIFFYHLGRKQEAAAHAETALANRLTQDAARARQYYGSINTWPLIDMLLMCDRTDDALKSIKEWEKQMDWDYTKAAMDNLVWYTSTDELLRLIPLLTAADNNIGGGELCFHKIMYERAWDRFADFEPYLGGSYQEKVFQAMASDKFPIDRSYVVKDLLVYYDQKKLQLAATYCPEALPEYFSKADVHIDQFVKDEFWSKYISTNCEKIFALGMAIELAGLTEAKKKDIEDRDLAYQVAYLLGRAAASRGAAATALIEEAQRISPDSWIDPANPDDYHRSDIKETLSNLAMQAAWRSGSPLFDQLFLDVLSGCNGQSQKSDLSVKLIALGNLNDALSIWVPKMPFSEIKDFVPSYCALQDYSRLYWLMEKIEKVEYRYEYMLEVLIQLSGGAIRHFEMR